MNNITLQDRYRIDAETSKYLYSLGEEFYKNDHELLHGKKIGAKLKREIEQAFYKYYSGMTELLEEELKDLKRDSFVNGNSNKRQWVMAYMLAWVCDLPVEPDAEYFYNRLTSREALRKVLEHVYIRGSK